MFESCRARQLNQQFAPLIRWDPDCHVDEFVDQIPPEHSIRSRLQA